MQSELVPPTEAEIVPIPVPGQLHREKPRSFAERWVGSYADGVVISADSCPLKFTEMTMAKIAAENGHVASRLGWVLTLNGFLFAAYGLCLTSTAKAPELKPTLDYFRSAISLSGMFASGLVLIGIMAAYSAINTHKRRWFANRARAKVVAPYPFSRPIPSLLGRIPSIGLCLFLGSVWADLWLTM